MRLQRILSMAALTVSMTLVVTGCTREKGSPSPSSDGGPTSKSDDRVVSDKETKTPTTQNNKGQATAGAWHTLEHPDVAYACYSSDGKRVISADSNMGVKEWDLSTGKAVGGWSGNKKSTTVGLSPNGRFAVSANYRDREVLFWDLAKREVTHSFKGQQEYDYEQVSVSFSGDSSRVMVSFSPLVGFSKSLDGGFRTTGRTYLFDPETGKEAAGVQHLPPPLALSWTGTTALVRQNSFVALFEIAKNGWGPSCAVDQNITCMAMAPKEDTLVVGTTKGELFVFDAKNGKKIQNFTAHKWEVTAVAISPDGKRSLTGGSTDPNKETAKIPEAEKFVGLWDLSTGKNLQRFTGHFGAVWGVAFAPDGDSAISWDGVTVRVWHTPK